MIVGVLATLIWEGLGKPFDLNSVLFAVPVSVIALVVVTFFTSRKKE